MNAREQSASIKKTVVENAARELVLEHTCELVETFPISKEKALMLSVIRSWDFLDSITKKKGNDRSKAIGEVDLELMQGSGAATCICMCRFHPRKAQQEQKHI